MELLSLQNCIRQFLILNLSLSLSPPNSCIYPYYYKQCPIVYFSINTSHTHNPYYYKSLLLYVYTHICIHLLLYCPIVYFSINTSHTHKPYVHSYPTLGAFRVPPKIPLFMLKSTLADTFSNSLMVGTFVLHFPLCVLHCIPVFTLPCAGTYFLVFPSDLCCKPQTTSASSCFRFL